jgi:predicted DNA-binding protein with PD1-like motif
MQAGSFDVRKVHVLRIDPNEDVLLSVTKFVAEARIVDAVVLAGYGTLASHRLHWVADNRLPSRNAYESASRGIEILSMNGMVVDGEPHIHVALSTPQGAYGGHLEEGCRVYVLCEVMLAEIAGPKLTRKQVEVDVPGMGRGRVTRMVFG